KAAPRPHLSGPQMRGRDPDFVADGFDTGYHYSPDAARMGERLPERIVVFCLPGIGDTLMFTPALAVLRRALPAAHVTAVAMFPGTAQALETNPDVDEVRTVELFGAGFAHRLRQVRTLRGGRFDLGVLPFPTNRLGYNLLNRAVARRWRAAHRYGTQSWQNLWF